MAIKKTLVHFKNKDRFNEELENNNILDTSICFIQDTKEIYTHGQLYDGSTFDPIDIETSIQNIITDKQDKLLSGTNIKTINGESILGEGDIIIEGGSPDTYYLELPLGEDGQCLSSGTLTQEQFEEMTSCKTLIVQTSNMSSDGISVSEDIAFDWRMTQIEQSDEGEMKGIVCSNIYPNPSNNCLTSYIFIFNSNGSECIYQLIAKQIFLGSDIFDPTAVDLSDNSIYELNISDNTESEEISEEEFNRIVASKNLIVNMGMHKILCIQRTAPEAYPDTYYFYGNFFDNAEQKITLYLMRKDGVCRYIIQTEELSSGGVPIVYSESSLDPNAKAGSLAVVSEEKIHSFGEIETYPMASETDGTTVNEAELTKIQSLDFQSITTLSTDINSGIMLIPEGFSYTNTDTGMMVAIQITDGIITFMYATISGESESFSLWDPTSGYNQETVDLIETRMSGKNWYLAGNMFGTRLSDEEVQVIDQLVKFKETNPELYIKRDEWVVFEKKGKRQINCGSYYYLRATLAPNIFYVWDEVSNLNIDLAPETPGIINEYLFQFTSGETATSLSFPSDIKWASDPIILPNKIYQISILNGLGSILQFDI